MSLPQLKSSFVVLTLSASLSIMSIGPAEATIVPGDVNQDSKVNIVDPIRLFAHLFNNNPLSDEALLNADVNLSGTVDTADAVYILNSLFANPLGPKPLHPPYCEILDPNGNSFNPPQYEPGTYWTNLGGPAFGGGFVSDYAVITNPAVYIERGASVCGNTLIDSAGPSTDVRITEDAVLNESTVNIVSNSLLLVQLLLRGDSRVSEAQITLDNYQVNFLDSDVSEGTVITGVDGENSPLRFTDSQVIGGIFEHQNSSWSPITVTSSLLTNAAVFGPSGDFLPNFITFSEVINDLGPTGPVGEINGSWQNFVVNMSTLVNTVVRTDYGMTDIQETISTGPSAGINGSALARWCVNPNEIYDDENCSSLSYNSSNCSFPLPAPAWPNCQ